MTFTSVMLIINTVILIAALIELHQARKRCEECCFEGDTEEEDTEEEDTEEEGNDEEDEKRKPKTKGIGG